MLRAVDLEVVGAQPDAGPGGAPARRVLLAPQRVTERAPEVEVERVAELERLGHLVALAAVAGVREPVRAERVAVEPREQLVEHLLPDPPMTPRGELEPVAVALEVAGTLEAVGEVLERIEVPGGVRAQQVVDVRAVDLAEVARPARAVDLRLELVERLEPPELLERALEAERLVAGEPDPLPQPAGEQLVEVRGELGEVPLEPVVAEQRVERVLELLALLGRQRPHQRLHRRHPVGELLDDVVERPRAREERAVLREELVDLGLRRLVALRAARRAAG